MQQTVTDARTVAVVGRAGRAALPATGAALLLTVSLQLPAAEPPAADIEPVPEVSVVAEQPGPALWRVSDGRHSVWILGTVPVLPKKLQWRSLDVERVLASSQEVIPSDPSVDLGLNPISGAYRYFQWLHLRVLPDHRTLQQVLPPDLYARFSSVRSRYTSDVDRFEHLQPMLAGAELWGVAMDTSRLSLSSEIEDHVLKLARQHRVPIRRYKLEMRDTGEVMRELGRLSVSDQVHCLEPMLALLESHISDMERRAAAWSVGDVDAFRAVPVPDPTKGCAEAVAGASVLVRAGQQAHASWKLAVQDALAHNDSTLAVQNLDSLLGPDGSLEELRAAGYTVEGPVRPARAPL